MRLIRLLFGAALGGLLVGVLWFGAILAPPESFSRHAAIWAAGATGDRGPATAERIPCPVLSKLRFYVVCTDDCASIWRIVGVWGLQPRVLSDPGRVPPEREGVARRRINTAVAREALTLDLESAREMIGCYMRLEGLEPELILPADGRAKVTSARGNDRAMSELYHQLDHPEALSRLDVKESGGEFVTRFEYLDALVPGWPVVGIYVRIASDGRMLGAERWVIDEGG